MPKLGNAIHHSGYHSLSYSKKGKDILAQASQKAEHLLAKIEERTERMKKVCEEAGVDTEYLRDLAHTDPPYGQQFTSDAGRGRARTLNVGQQAMLVEEWRHINQEQEELERLRVIVDHLDADGAFDLNYDEVRALWFWKGD